MMIDETEISVMEVANIISKKFGFNDDDLIFDETKPKGQFKKPASSDIKNFNFKSIEDGINETIDWFIQNYKTARK
jgi:GDP-L-fucose synthase